MPRFVSLLRSLFAVFVLGVCFGPAVLAQDPARTVSDTVPLARDGEVTVDNHEGSITVTPWDRDAVQYEAQIMPTEEDPDAEKVTIRVHQSENRLRLATEHEDGDDESTVFGFSDDGWQWGGTDIPAVHYTIKMPRRAALTIDDHESTIDVTGLRAELRIDTHEGPVSVTDQRGEVTIDSHESPISISEQEGDVTIDTHEGRMDLRQVVGHLEVDTHDGDLTVEGLEGGFRLDTHDGTATVSFATLTEDVSADTHDGDVTLSLPAGTGFDLNTDFDDDTNVTSDFDLDPIRIVDEDDDDEVNYRGDVNGGGPEIYLESHDGDFRLRSH